METLTPRQLTILAMIIALSGAGGSMMAPRQTSQSAPSLTHTAVLRDELDRLERRHEALMRRVRDLEVQLHSG